MVENYLNSFLIGRAENILKTFSENSVDMILTSPPYDNLRSYNGYIFDFRIMAKELSRVLKPGGVIVWIVGDSVIKGSESLSSFKQAIHFVEECALNLHDTMIYQKRSYLPQGGHRYDQVFEYMFVFSKGKPKTFNPIMVEKVKVYAHREKGFHRDKDGKHKIGEYKNDSKIKKKTNIWPFLNAGGQCTKDKEAYKHGAIFPEKLAEDHIRSWSNESDIILDPMMGSGTVAKMCKILGRFFIGIDISEEYCISAMERVKNIGGVWKIHNEYPTKMQDLSEEQTT